MRQASIGLIISFLFFSCNGNKIEELNNRISKLQIQNTKLSDSISKFNNAILEANVVPFTEKIPLTGITEFHYK